MCTILGQLTYSSPEYSSGQAMRQTALCVVSSVSSVDQPLTVSACCDMLSAARSRAIRLRDKKLNNVRLFLCEAADWGVFSSVLLQQLNFVVALPRLMVIAPPIASVQALALQLGLLMLVIDLSYIAGRKVLFIFK